MQGRRTVNDEMLPSSLSAESLRLADELTTANEAMRLAFERMAEGLTAARCAAVMKWADDHVAAAQAGAPRSPGRRGAPARPATCADIVPALATRAGGTTRRLWALLSARLSGHQRRTYGSPGHMARAVLVVGYLGACARGQPWPMMAA